ncbi:MAG: hypothetical protein PHG69_00950 [Candidatus Omnitrophica bacterium]|nr:hypothetical protein [Candidatus Omnitrophota bacterium]
MGFQIQLKNVGRAPANDVHVDHEIDWMLKFLPKNKIKGEKLKKIISEVEKSDVICFQKIPQELMDDEEYRQFSKEINSKDVIIKPTADRWTAMSVFPGESFEYKLGMIISGKDAKWYIDNFNKIKWLNFELTAYYKGVLLNIGKPYYSKYKALFDSNKLVPYEIESH